MKIVSSIALVAVCALSGCASGPPSTQRVASIPRFEDTGYDMEKVAAIDRAAKARGIEIHWQHYPQRRPDAPVATVTPTPAVPTGT